MIEKRVVDEVLESALARVIVAEVQDALWRRKHSRKFAVDVLKPKKRGSLTDQ
jgi:hypothetical protein